MASKQENLDKLKYKLKRIYQPLEGHRFEAWYKGIKPIKVTGAERALFTMLNVGFSEEANAVVTTVLDELEEKTFNDQPLTDIVWSGITLSEGGYSSLWIRPDDLPGGEEYQEGDRYTFVFGRPSIDIFDERDVLWIKSYKAGVNIKLIIDDADSDN